MYWSLVALTIAHVCYVVLLSASAQEIECQCPKLPPEPILHWMVPSNFEGSVTLHPADGTEPDLEDSLSGIRIDISGWEQDDGSVTLSHSQSHLRLYGSYRCVLWQSSLDGKFELVSQMKFHCDGEPVKALTDRHRAVVQEDPTIYWIIGAGASVTSFLCALMYGRCRRRRSMAVR